MIIIEIVQRQHYGIPLGKLTDAAVESVKKSVNSELTLLAKKPKTYLVEYVKGVVGRMQGW